jgi:hypothetical protein
LERQAKIVLFRYYPFIRMAQSNVLILKLRASDLPIKDNYLQGLSRPPYGVMAMCTNDGVCWVQGAKPILTLRCREHSVMGTVRPAQLMKEVISQYGFSNRIAWQEI